MMDNFRTLPDRAVALERYRELAEGYDATCRWIEPLRRAALQVLAPAEGEVAAR